MTPGAAGAGTPGRKSLGLALGGGGARSLAQIAVIEALEAAGIRPAVIAGSSMGALVGACYAAGMSGKAMRRHVIELAHDRNATFRRLLSARAGSFAELFGSGLGNPVLVDAEKFCTAFLPPELPQSFEDLRIPLRVVATDLAGCAEVAFVSGPLRPALAASMAVPALVRPVMIDGRAFVDGAAVNPLPFDHLFGRADVVLAIDSSGGLPEPGDVPDAWDSLFATLTVMGNTITAAKLRDRKPDLMIKPVAAPFRVLDFFRASAILRTAELTLVDFVKILDALLRPEGRGGR